MVMRVLRDGRGVRSEHDGLGAQDAPSGAKQKDTLRHIVNAHITDVNLDRQAWRFLQRLPSPPLDAALRKSPPASSSRGLEEIAGRSIGIDTENRIVHIEPDTM